MFRMFWGKKSLIKGREGFIVSDPLRNIYLNARTPLEPLGLVCFEFLNDTYVMVFGWYSREKQVKKPVRSFR